MKKFRKILLWAIIGTMALILVLIGSLYFYAYQTRLAKQLATWLSEKTHTKVEIGSLKLNWFENLKLENVYIEDLNKDTLLFSKTLFIKGENLLNDKRVIAKIALEQVVFNKHRQSNSYKWNLDEVLTNLISSQKSSSGKSNPIKLGLKLIELNNIRYKEKDEMYGETQNYKIGKAVLHVNKLDIENQSIDLNSVVIDKPSLVIEQYPASPHKDELVAQRNKSRKKKSSTSNEKNNSGKLHIKTIQLINGTFVLAKIPRSKSTENNYFNEENIQINDLNASLNNFSLSEDGINTWINLNCKERSGIEIKQLKSNMHMDFKKTIFKNLVLKTNQSEIGNYLKFTYDNIENLSSFISKVVMEGHFENSRCHTNDIAYFAPEMKTWNILADNFTGDFKGTVENFTAEIKNLHTSQTQFSGTVVMVGLPDIDNTQMNIQSKNLNTSYKEIVSIAPQLKQVKEVKFDKFGNINYVGNFVGKYNNFNAKGRINSDAGILDVSRFNLDMSKPTPVYGGELEFSKMDLKQIIPGTPVQNSKGRIKFSAKGFDYHDLNLQCQGVLEHISVMNYNLNALNFSSTINNKIIKSTLNASSAEIDGKVILEFEQIDNAQSRIKVDGNLNALDLSKMGNLGNGLNFSGKLAGDFRTDFKDQISGFLDFENAVFHSFGKESQFERLRIEALSINQDHVYTFSSPEFGGYLKGDFTFSELENLIKYHIAKSLPSYVNPVNSEKGLDRRVELKVVGNNFTKLIQIFNNDLSIPDSVNIKGEISKTVFAINGRMEKFIFQDFMFENLKLNFDNDKEHFGGNILVNDFYYEGQKTVSQIKLNSHFENDKAVIKLTTGEGDSKTDLEFDALAQRDTIEIDLKPSKLNLRDNLWSLESNHKIKYHKDYLFVNNLILSNREQKIKIFTESPMFSDQSNIYFDISNLEMKTINEIANIEEYQLDTKIGGRIIVEKPFGDFSIVSNLEGPHLKMEDREIGDVKILATMNSHDKEIQIISPSGIKTQNSTIAINGKIVLDTTKMTNIEFTSSNYDISPIESSFQLYVRNLKGILDGKFSLSGPYNQLKTDGKITLKNVSLYVDQTGITYSIPELTVRSATDIANQTIFELDSTLIYDDLNKTAILTGNIEHKNFSNFSIFAMINSGNFHLLNTNPSINEVVYGDVTGEVQALLLGSIEDLTFSIHTTPKEKSKVFIINTDDDVSDDIDYIKFANNTNDSTSKITDDYKLNFTVSTTLNDKLSTIFVIDPSDGSNIEAKEGNGKIDMQMYFGVQNKDNLTVSGEYIFDQGSMTYFDANSLGISTLIGAKKFVIEPGTKVDFKEDPYNPKVVGSAIYETKMTLESLFTEEEMAGFTIDQVNQIKKEQKVELLAKMNGEAMKFEKIQYEINFPDILEKKHPAFIKLEEIKANAQNLVLQAGYIFSLNKFNLSSQTSSDITSDATSAMLINTSKLLTNTITKEVNQWISKVLNSKSVNLNTDVVIQKDGSKQSSTAVEAYKPVFVLNGSVKLLKDDRLTLKWLYNMDLYTTNSISNSGSNYSGNYLLNYTLDSSGKSSIYHFFSANNNNTSVINQSSIGNIIKSGIGFSYSLEFDRFNDIIRKKKSNIDPSLEKK